GTFIEDQAGLRLLDIIGEDNVMLECDYPHSDSTWPDTINLARKWLGHLPEDTQHKITISNASRVYNFTPADPASISGGLTASAPDPLLVATALTRLAGHEWRRTWSDEAVGRAGHRLRGGAADGPLLRAAARLRDPRPGPALGAAVRPGGRRPPQHPGRAALR